MTKRIRTEVHVMPELSQHLIYLFCFQQTHLSSRPQEGAFGCDPNKTNAKL
jgi:hypothetical protein